MIVASNDSRVDRGEQVAYAIFDRTRWRASKHQLELCAANFLSPPHTSLSPHRAVRVVEKVSRVHVQCDIVMKWKVLAPLKRLEAIDHDLIHSANAF